MSRIPRGAALRLVAAGALALAVAAGAYLTQQAAFGPQPVYVHIRWAPDVDDTLRRGFEQRFRLADPEHLDGRTWGYTLLDPSRANIQAFVTSPAVEDTQDVDRSRFAVLATATRRPHVTAYPRAPRLLRSLTTVALFLGLVALVLGATGYAAPQAMSAWLAERRRADAVLGLILLSALVPRAYVAATAPYIHDEDASSIPRSQLISFAPDSLNLPIRGQNHPALPAYFVKVSSLLFGTTPLGYRLLHLLTGLATIVMMFFFARAWFGVGAARWTAALLAFNEYYLGVSSRATAHVPYLLCIGASLFAFGRFLSTERPRALYAAAAALGAAFYAKEHSVLLLAVFLAMMLHAKYRQWFRRPHLYLAVTVYLLVVTPDLLWNLRAQDGTQQATYGDHLQRIGGFGYSPYPLMFFARDLVQRVHMRLTGSPLIDRTTEYLSMNTALGLLLLGAVGWAMTRRVLSLERRYLLLAFWIVFGFFSLIRPGLTPKDLDPVSWIWVEATIVPTTLLAGAMLAQAPPRARTPLWSAAGAAMVFAVVAFLSR